MREPYLDSDYSESIAKPATYDADLENFWTQSSKFYFELKLIIEDFTNETIYFEN
jgi:hypothetical protein